LFRALDKACARQTELTQEREVSVTRGGALLVGKFESSNAHRILQYFIYFVFLCIMKAALLSGEALLARVLSMAHQCRSMRPRWHIPLTSPLPSQFISLRAFTTSNQLGRNVRVAAARETRFEDPKGCPACGQVCFRPSTYHAHLQRCCPDLLDLSPLISGAIDDAAVDAWLAIAHTQEEGLRARSVRSCRCRSRSNPVSVQRPF